MLKGEGILPTTNGDVNMDAAARGNTAWPRITTTALYLQLTVGNHPRNSTNSTYTFNFPAGVYLDWAIYEMRLF